MQGREKAAYSLRRSPLHPLWVPQTPPPPPGRGLPPQAPAKEDSACGGVRRAQPRQPPTAAAPPSLGNALEELMGELLPESHWYLEEETQEALLVATTGASQSTRMGGFRALCSPQGGGCHEGWVLRRSRATYLCGGVLDDLRLIGQGLLLRGKRTVRWCPWGRRSHWGDIPGPPSGFLSPTSPSHGDHAKRRSHFLLPVWAPGFIHWKRNSPTDPSGVGYVPCSREALLAPLLTGAARALPARQRRKKIQALIFQQTLNKGEEEEG